MARGDIEIHHYDTDEMWAAVNINPTQKKRVRIMHGKVMGVPIDYDDNVERRHTHPMLMPKIESERTLMPDGKILEKVAIVAPAKPPTKKAKKGIQRDSTQKFDSTPSEAGGETKECVGRAQIYSWSGAPVEAWQCCTIKIECFKLFFGKFMLIDSV